MAPPRMYTAILQAQDHQVHHHPMTLQSLATRITLLLRHPLPPAPHTPNTHHSLHLLLCPSVSLYALYRTWFILVHHLRLMRI